MYRPGISRGSGHLVRVERPAVEPVAQTLDVDASSNRVTLGAERRSWQTVYVRRLCATDTIIVVGAVVLAQTIRFGGPDLATSAALRQTSYSIVSVGLMALWLGALIIFRTRSVRVIGSGPEEYRRIAGSALRLFGLIAIASLLLHLDPARLYLAIAFPVGLVGLLVSRWCWRRLIVRKRARGGFRTSVLVVGGRGSVQSLAQSFERRVAEGYHVVGVCIPGHSGDGLGVIRVDGRDIPVLGGEGDVVGALALCGADTVAVTATEHLGPTGIRKLVWDLESLDVDLVVAPGVVDVAGPRLSMRPVAGLPLIHVEKPQYHGAQSFAKTSFDVLFALLALIVLSPIMIVAGLAIKLTMAGPIFYRSERIGLDGRPFAMLKFRSMIVGADEQMQTLLAVNDGAGLLFKLREDPRVTPVGRMLRKFSIDEIPQFINVLRRDMSVVGPRPPLRKEVAAYDGTVRRRLLVKPGITGIWQVSGRSELSWDEAVRLDLSYVENWSMVGDLLIIGKTVRAVLAGDGAY